MTTTITLIIDDPADPAAFEEAGALLGQPAVTGATATGLFSDAERA